MTLKIVHLYIDNCFFCVFFKTILISHILYTYKYILKATFFSVFSAVMIWWRVMAYQKIAVLHGKHSRPIIRISVLRTCL